MFCILHNSLAFVCIYYRENYEITALQIVRCKEICYSSPTEIKQKYVCNELSVLWVDFEEISAVRLEHHITTTGHVNQSNSAWHKVRRARERLEAKHLSVLHPVLVAFMEAINLAVNGGGQAVSL